MHKLLFATIFVSLAPASLSAATLFLSGPSTPVSVGQSFDVLVQVNGVFDPPRAGDEVIGFGFDITNSNPGAFNLLSFTVGPLFDDFSALFPSTDVVGVPNLPGFTIPDPLTSPPLLLATLHFLATDTGGGQLGVTSNPLDPNEGLQYLSSADAAVPLSNSLSITSLAATATPEPSSFLLVLAGMIMLSGVLARRKKA